MHWPPLPGRRSTCSTAGPWFWSTSYGGTPWSTRAVKTSRSRLFDKPRVIGITSAPTVAHFKSRPGRRWNGNGPSCAWRDTGVVGSARSAITSRLPSVALDPDQRRAAEHILASRDFVTLFRGGAGTGKSFTLREVKNGLRTAGHSLQVLAPQRQQVIDLERDGMTGAQTVSEFLTKQDMPRGAVIMVDEAGQIGAKQMQRLLRFVRDNHGRVILSGDTRQHGAVEASDALRAIEKYSGLRAAELQEIRRQDPARARTKAEQAQIIEYRQAVKEASEGKLVDSFRRLDRQAQLWSVSPSTNRSELAETFLELAEGNHSVVVVSQTRSEIHQVNDHVRSALRSRGRIGANEQVVAALEPVDLTAAQKRDRRFYDENSVVLLNRNAGGFRKGETARLVAITQTGLVLEGGERIRRVPVPIPGPVDCLPASRTRVEHRATVCN